MFEELNFGEYPYCFPFLILKEFNIPFPSKMIKFSLSGESEKPLILFEFGN